MTDEMFQEFSAFTDDVIDTLDQEPARVADLQIPTEGGSRVVWHLQPRPTADGFDWATRGCVQVRSVFTKEGKVAIPLQEASDPRWLQYDTSPNPRVAQHWYQLVVQIPTVDEPGKKQIDWKLLEKQASGHSLGFRRLKLTKRSFEQLGEQLSGDASKLAKQLLRITLTSAKYKTFSCNLLATQTFFSEERADLRKAIMDQASTLLPLLIKDHKQKTLAQMAPAEDSFSNPGEDMGDYL